MQRLNSFTIVERSNEVYVFLCRSLTRYLKQLSVKAHNKHILLLLLVLSPIVTVDITTLFLGKTPTCQRLQKVFFVTIIVPKQKEIGLLDFRLKPA